MTGSRREPWVEAAQNRSACNSIGSKALAQFSGHDPLRLLSLLVPLTKARIVPEIRVD